jgi:hypothetical protein
MEANSIDWTQQSRFHLMTREEPSLETLWLKNVSKMDKVQIIDRSTYEYAFRVMLKYAKNELTVFWFNALFPFFDN